YGIVKSSSKKGSVQSVISNDDLLTAILVRLPLLSLIFFKSVSKRWLSLIKDDENLDPPAGLFLQKNSGYDFLSLDKRIPICRSSLLATNFTFGPEVHGDVHILHSCNGLLLCHTSSLELYVYNPSFTNMFKLIPEPDNVTYNINSIIACFGLAFDPAKSPHYKVVYAEMVNDHAWDDVFQLHTFSSETGNWSLCGPQFNENDFHFFGIGVYWNDAIYWRNVCRNDIFKFDIMNERLVLTALPTPLALDLKVHYECHLFECRGCLLLVAKESDCSRHFTIYEKGNVYSEEWSVKYIVNIDHIIKPFPKSWFIYRTLYSIVLEEREEDSFLVMKLDKKVVQYKIATKTLSTISELGPYDDLGTCFQFIPSFANV
ncbi:AT-hook motif nuclear-localized protein 28-like protein, partial [Tanacetum coccineum]